MLKRWTEKLRSSSKSQDVEEIQEKLKYPRSIPFIVSNEFCERFNFYGMRTVLTIYLTQKLKFDENTATVTYHAFVSLVYFTCILGAILSDALLGKFFTILYLSCVYAMGSIMITVGAIEPLNLPMNIFTLVGLLLIAFGAGGIKPCVSAFGGEQFTLPQQAAQLASFFSVFYFAINAGSMISTILTPILREDVKCYGMSDCFPLAFGVPAILMVFSVIIFVFGRFMYKIVPPQGNMLVKVCQCIASAIKLRKQEKSANLREHWLDYAESKHGKKLVNETKVLLNILVLYLPLPFFWALYDQQGSRWTLQSLRMDGQIGFYKIKPDQMQFVNPLLILIFIPVFDFVIYPLLNLIGIRRPLQKMAVGGILAGISFIISGLIEIAVNTGQPLNILWQLPQYVVVTFGEVMFSITGLHFSFTEAPESMKSVIQGCWLLTTAFGNVIVVIVAGSNTLSSQTVEFFLFAGLMFFDMMIFMWLAARYKSISFEELGEEEKEEKK